MKFPRLIVCLVCSVGSLCARDTHWTRLDAQNFTIISAVSEAETRNWAVEFEEFHRGIAKVLSIHESLLQPVTVVLFQSDDEMRAYKPLEKGRPAEVDGLFMRSPLGNFIEMAAGSEDQRTRQLIFHEGVHWLTNVSDEPPPLWLDEGLAEVFSTFSTEDNLYNYGNVLPWHVLLLHRQGMMPLKKLLAVRRGSLLYNEGERTSIFYAESWAFVHYLLFSGRLEQRTKFNELVLGLNAGTDPDTVFRQVFGCDCAAMDMRLKEYLSDGTYTISRLRFDRTAVEQSFTVRPARSLEVALAENSLLAVVNRPAQALPELQYIASQMRDNPLAWEAAGFAAYQTEDYDETERCFRNAADKGSRNYFVYSFLGDATLGLRPGSLVPMGGDARQALDLYERELALNPRDLHAYQNFAGNCYSLDPLTPRDVEVLRAGEHRYPGDGLIRVGSAVVDLRAGRIDTATARLQAIAADASLSNRQAAAFARFILDDRARTETYDRINHCWQSQDFAGVIAVVDERLKAQIPKADRDNLLQTRARAQDAANINRAIEMAGSGRISEARHLLEETAANAADIQMKKQIEVILGRMAKASDRTSP